MKQEQLEGRNVILEALRAGRKFKRLLLDSQAREDEKLKEIISLARENKVSIEKVDRHRLDDISRTGVHLGIIGWALPRRSISLKELVEDCRAKGEVAFLLILKEVLYEQNLGAILRSAESAGVHGVIVPSRQGAGVTPNVIRISMGASEYVPVIRGSIMSSISFLKRSGVWIIGADMEGDDIYYEVDLTGPVAFVLGGEDKGLSEAIKSKCDRIVRIPMKGHISSLNVSVTCALLMYEKLRQEAEVKRT
jgi:23S rRNA (guanosine2251-2'-O)-methyltransferase